MSKEREAQIASEDIEERGTDLRESVMMTHLLDALEEGTDIGHYGRLTFVMVARFFMEEDEMINLLAKQPDLDEEDAETLVLEVKAHDYNPPKRERIIEWQEQQDFAICPNPHDPDSCNVYSELRFPDHIYENIEEYWEGKVEALREERHQES